MKMWSFCRYKLWALQFESFLFTVAAQEHRNEVLRDILNMNSFGVNLLKCKLLITFFRQVIDRRVRELNVYTEILPLETPLSVLLEQKFKYVLFLNSTASVKQCSFTFR